MDENVDKSTDSKLKSSEFLANYFGITVRRVQQLAQDGTIPSIKEKGNYFFDVPVAIRKYITYLQDALKQRSKSTEEQEIKKLDVDIRLKEAKASYAEIELNELKGKMHRAEDVEDLISDLAATIRGMIMALPGRLAMDIVQIETPAEVSEFIEKFCFEICDKLADYKYEKEYFKAKVHERGGLNAEDLSE